MPVQRLLNIVSEALVVSSRSLTGLKFGRTFQLPLCSVYVVCVALFSQNSLVVSIKFFDALSF